MQVLLSYRSSSIFFFKHATTTEIYTLSLHDALPISRPPLHRVLLDSGVSVYGRAVVIASGARYRRIEIDNLDLFERSEEHTSELQSQSNLVCRLLLEKKKAQIEYTVANTYTDAVDDT